MARSDITNRNREHVHRNYMYQDVNSIITGAFGDLRDTFIFNQSWWLKDRVHEYSGLNTLDDVGLYFKFIDPSGPQGAGVTSGHTHTIPEKRAELVLGLSNPLRTNVDVDAKHGCGLQMTDAKVVKTSCLPEEMLQLHVWDPNDWNDGENFGHPDMDPQPSFGGTPWPDDLMEPNWMHNQPPSFERTPFRPVFNVDFRDDTKAAVPVGGFLKQAKMVLTVSQQSIAWPRDGFNAEFWKLVDDCDETCDWWRKSKETPYAQLQQDSSGNTLGNWWDSSLIGGQTSGGAVHYLPVPQHPALGPMLQAGDKENTLRFWTIFNGQGPGKHPYDPADLFGCNSPTWINPHTEVWPAYDNQFSFEDVQSRGVPKCRVVALPTEHTATSAFQDVNTYLNNWFQGEALDSWRFLIRAPETGGFTGCGGAIDISEAGFESSSVFDGSITNSSWYNYDNEFVSTASGESIETWRKVRKRNCREIHIPKFTNAGFSGSYNNLTIPSGQFNYATGPSGAADGRGITFAVDIGWWGRQSIAFSGQKLNLLLKGEYNPNGTKSLDSKYESSRAHVEFPHPNRHLITGGDISYFSGPIDTSLGNPGQSDSLQTVQNLDPVLPLTGTGAYPMTWTTSAAEVATNFYSVESPAPYTNAFLTFRTKGSTLDIETGNMIMDFTLWNSLPTPLYPYDTVKIKWGAQVPGGDFLEDDKRRRALWFINKLKDTDTFEFTMGGRITDSDGNDHSTSANTYKIVAGTVNIQDNQTSGYVEFGVTGDKSLFPTFNATGFPQILHYDVAERLEGEYKIDTDDEHWIVTPSGTQFLTTFSANNINGDPAPHEIYPSLTNEQAEDDSLDKSFALAKHPNGGFYPNGPDQIIIPQVNAGITGGGSSFIKLKRSQITSENDGSYTVLEAYYKDDINHITRDYIRVKEPVKLEAHSGDGNPFGLRYSVERVDHHPRIEITYRTKRQYDIP